MRRIKTRIVSILLLCCVFMVTILFYFMLTFEEQKHLENIYSINKSKSVLMFQFSEVKQDNRSLKEIFELKLKDKLNIINFDVLRTLENYNAIEKYIKSLKDNLDVNTNSSNIEKIWSISKKWVRARQTIPQNAPELGTVLSSLQTAKIIKSDVSRKGTQLKLLLTLEGGQFVLFKPKRYSRDFITDDIYSGADRHNGEIVAFHLSRILNLRFVPITSSRIVHVTKEIKALASESLLNTFVTDTDSKNRTRQCFYGECYYCNEYDLVCGDENNFLEGAVILMLPIQYQLQKLKHPWQRTYKKSMKAQWEVDSHFCLSVLKNKPMQQRVLDYVDVSIFDFLIGNADRHHYEVFKDVSNSALLLIDNGKSFGDPNHDEITILFPLLQCCIIRNSTYHHLSMLASHKLSTIIENLLAKDILWPLLTKPHLEALDRRLLSVLASIHICFDSFNKHYVLKN